MLIEITQTRAITLIIDSFYRVSPLFHSPNIAFMITIILRRRGRNLLRNIAFPRHFKTKFTISIPSFGHILLCAVDLEMYMYSKWAKKTCQVGTTFRFGFGWSHRFLAHIHQGRGDWFPCINTDINTEKKAKGNPQWLHDDAKTKRILCSRLGSLKYFPVVECTIVTLFFCSYDPSYKSIRT